jgi:MFS family permease
MESPSWLVALGVTLLMQTTASFMGQCLPVLAPLLTAGAGVAPERIGDLSALVSFGTMLFLTFGSAFLARLGPVRTLQCGALLAAAALLLAASGRWPALVLAALLLGIGYGPTPPAGSRILAATVPLAHRTLIFSVKQAGAPMGGALAGLLVAPVAAAFGCPLALALAIGVGVLAALLIVPFRRQLDAERDRNRPIHLRALAGRGNVLAPLRALRTSRLLLSITVLSVSFSIVQGTLFSFSVTYLARRGLSLEQAGLAYACMQGAGVFARVALGWLADRTGRPAVNLTVQAYVAAGLVIAYALLPAAAGFATTSAVATAVGFVGASWNGIYMAEVARLSPPELVADATSGSTLLTFVGYVAGPALFALAVPYCGWSVPFVAVGAQMLAMAVLQTVVLWRLGAAVSGTSD